MMSSYLDGSSSECRRWSQTAIKANRTLGGQGFPGSYAACVTGGAWRVRRGRGGVTVSGGVSVGEIDE